jgi:hypothetical protein
VPLQSSPVAQEQSRPDGQTAQSRNTSVTAADDGEDDEDDGSEDDEDDEDENENDDKDDSEENENERTSSWTLSGTVTRALLPWSDGGRRGIRIVDNPQDSTGISLAGEFGLGQGWTAGATFSLYAYYASSDTVTQLDWNGDGTYIQPSDAYFNIGHEKWGEIVVGLQSPATDGIDSINLSESDMVADASVSSWNSNFFLRRAGPGVGLATGRESALTGDDTRGADEGDETSGNAASADLRWGDFLDGPLAGSVGRFITYVSPDIMDFEVAASIGRPEYIAFVDQGNSVYDRTERGFFRDLALRYSADWGDAFEVSAGLGVWKDTSGERDADEPTKDSGWGGSFALKHVSTGMSFAVNYGTTSHTNGCSEPGDVTGRCRGDDRFLYMKAGIVRNPFEWGPTAFYGEHYRGWKAQHETDDDVLRFLEAKEGMAEELKGSTASVWGFGIAQTIKATSVKPYTTELYLGYRHYDLDVRLIGSAGPVPSRRIKDFDVIMAGVTIRWGDEPEDELGRPLGRHAAQ